jgi:DNA-binding XRE family transcriptional regulator
MSVSEAGWRLGIARREYVAIEDGEQPPNADQYETICEFFGWPDSRSQSGSHSRRPTRS